MDNSTHTLLVGVMTAFSNEVVSSAKNLIAKTANSRP